MTGASIEDDPPPFLRLMPPGEPGPLVISVPHAGHHYPAAIDAARAVAWTVLHDLEDRHVDRLIGPAIAAGAVAVVATHARAWIDLNRDGADRDGAPTSPHGRAGLGIVPQRLGGRSLWRAPTPDAAVGARVARCHRPYHAAIAEALAAARARHGHALLIDCHSMPPITSGRGKGARIVFGDRHGTSAAPAIVGDLIGAARHEGLHPALNTPYAGAYTLERHGRPHEGIHAIQFELDRSLYLDRTLREPSPALEPTARLVAQLCVAALAAAASGPIAVAAE